MLTSNQILNRKLIVSTLLFTIDARQLISQENKTITIGETAVLIAFGY